MTRFIIVVCLLAVQLNCGLSATTVTFSDKRCIVEMYIHDSTATNCILVSNKGIKFTYKPGIGVLDEDSRIHAPSRDSCMVEIRQSDKNDLGLWTITQYDKNGKSTDYEFNVYFEEYGSTKPTNTIVIYKEHYAFAKIANDLQDIVACEVTTPKKDTFDIFKVTKGNIEKFDTCGVRIMVVTKLRNEYSGKWRLAAINKNKELVSAEFEVIVKDDTELITAQQNIRLKLGSSSEIELKNVPSSYCQLIDSHGTQFPLTTGRCQHSIQVVTPYHAGIWKARYGVPGRLDSIETDIMVTTYDPEAIITNITATKNYDEVNMMCYLPESEPLNYCLFISPDGKMLQINAGVGTKKYEFYRETNKGICGITIHKPEKNDYGIWRCELTLDKYRMNDEQRDKRFSSFLYLYNDKENEVPTANYQVKNVNVFGYDVSVKQNDSFTIKCGADAILHYCWLRSPSGITYSITTDVHSLSPKTLLYTGPGFQTGVCEAIIPNAIYEHKGTWNCYMGIRNHPELEKSIFVDVADNYIVSEETQNSDAGRNLLCHLLPHLNKTIDYCRWIRPDGRGIYGEASDQYVSEMYNKSCSLTIVGKELRSEDIGLWTCIAGLAGRTTMEVSANIDINKPTMQIATLAGIVIGACALLGIVTVILVLVNMRKRRRAMLPSKNPPPYDAEQIQGIPPKPMLQTQMQYDQKDWNDSRAMS